MEVAGTSFFTPLVRWRRYSSQIHLSTYASRSPLSTGSHALLNSIGLVDSIAEFDAFFTQVPTFIEGILDVTHPMFNDAATQLKLTSEQASALHTQLDNFLLLASFEHGDVHHSNILHTLRPDFALCLPYFPPSLCPTFLLVQSPDVLTT